MDADNDSYTEVAAVDQNCVVEKNQSVGPESVSEVVSGFRDASLERMVETTTNDVAGQTNGSPSSEKVQTKECKEPEPQKVHTKGKREKPSNIKNGTQVSTKKITNTPNGSLAANTQSKQPVMKTKSFNDRHATNSDLSKGAKVAPATSNTRKDKLQKSEMVPSSGNLVQSEGNEEKSSMNPLREGSATISEGDNESVDAKSHKVGKLPSYGFSFKCHERAEKRKEFYTKLEERIHAQEIEKNNQQAKSKESQQAEIKMLRKSLNFKATPMPTFYQEPPPPKVELKKMPITRPKSPKLGRKKNPSSVGDSDQTRRPARLSLDEKVVSHHNPAQGPGPIHSKQPQRKSLPRLPSEKTRISKTSLDATSAETPPIADIKEEASLPKEFVPIARLNDEEVQVSDLGFVPIARVEDGDLLSDPDAAPEKDETHVRQEQEPTSLQ
ncbi:protein WVD2-like 5 isoform X2 [Silene latifolia]|uniref:protein WVD2-like 5 isoform X2 n=1 Tax=Silene latifolia TaxID=37657 RepID=UPI003D788C59